MSLTFTTINKFAPTEKCTLNRPDKYSDGDGLQLWVRHTRNKVLISAYCWQGKQQQTLTLGKYPVLTLQDSRKHNLEIKQMLADGINPKEKKKEQQASQDATRLFDTIAQEWYTERKT